MYHVWSNSPRIVSSDTMIVLLKVRLDNEVVAGKAPRLWLQAQEDCKRSTVCLKTSATSNAAIENLYTFCYIYSGFSISIVATQSQS